MDHQKERSDEQLIMDIRNGDNRAWEQLMVRFKPLIISVIRQEAGDNRHKEIVEELMQAGWLGFVNAVTNYDAKKAKKSKF